MSPLHARRALFIGLAPVAALIIGSTQGVTPAMAQTKTGKAQLGSWGVELTAMDRSVQPGDDFFRYTGGTWMKSTPIPPDRSRWGAFSILGAKSEDDVRAALEEAAKARQAPGSAAQKAVDYYRSYIDTTAIDARGIAAAQPELAAIAACQTHEDIVKLSTAPSFRANLPIGMGVTLDPKRPDVYIVGVAQSGLGMPDRDYYLKDDPKFADARAKYRTYVESMLKLSGDAQAAADADSIVAVEKRIAEIQWPREKSRDRDLTYNPKNRAELLAFAPEFPWEAGITAFGAPAQNEFIVSQLDAVQSLAKLYRSTPVSVWRAYLTFHYLNANADVLPKAFDDLSFDFNGKTLTGTPVQRARWKRAVQVMSGAPFNAPMGEAVGALYVKRTFSPESKAEMARLVENLRAAYKVRISKLPWMTEDTRKAALRKLETIRVKIGYPDRWRDYSTLEIKPGDAYGNRQRENAFQRARDIARLAKGADRDDWGMSPQTVNAYYNSTWNEIVFPAAILQPPFFDVNADAAVNYGGIGAVIGHEMGHGFDDQGAKSDEKGVLRKWWVEEDERRFKELTGKLSDQYSKFEALPGLFVNGKLTLGENIGDLGGLNVALEAYRISLNGKEPPVRDGFTSQQRFFLGFGQIWRQITRDEALRQQVTSDGHSPAEFRANGTVRNMDEWYAAFGVQPSAKLYLAPDQRVRIW